MKWIDIKEQQPEKDKEVLIGMVKFIKESYASLTIKMNNQGCIFLLTGCHYHLRLFFTSRSVARCP
jgi:hypothetical protein